MAYRDFLEEDCKICGSKEDLEVHHKNSQVSHPELVNERTNCVTICNRCHTIYHTVWNNSFQSRVEESDWYSFISVIERFRNRKQRTDSLEFGCFLKNI